MRNEEQHNLQTPPNINKDYREDGMNEHEGDTKDAYKILVKNVKGIDYHNDKE